MEYESLNTGSERLSAYFKLGITACLDISIEF